MNRWTKLLVVGGGMAAGIVGAGLAAANDLRKRKTKKTVEKAEILHIKPKYRRVYFWPS